MRFCEGLLHSVNVVCVQCGIGKVNAALCVQILKDRFNAECIINTGVAGALSDELDIGDIVISSEAVQHDFDLSPIGYQKAEIPPFHTVAFPADPGLQQLAAQTAQAVLQDHRVFCGRICSGDQFIFGEEMENRLERLTGFGLKGVEAFYFGFSSKLTKQMLSLSERYQLFVTAGSDYHGKNKLVKIGNTGMTENAVPVPGMQRFLDTVKICYASDRDYTRDRN